MKLPSGFGFCRSRESEKIGIVHIVKLSEKGILCSPESKVEKVFGTATLAKVCQNCEDELLRRMSSFHKK